MYAAFYTVQGQSLFVDSTQKVDKYNFVKYENYHRISKSFFLLTDAWVIEQSKRLKKKVVFLLYAIFWLILKLSGVLKCYNFLFWSTNICKYLCELVSKMLWNKKFERMRVKLFFKNYLLVQLFKGFLAT